SEPPHRVRIETSPIAPGQRGPPAVLAQLGGLDTFTRDRGETRQCSRVILVLLDADRRNPVDDRALRGLVTLDYVPHRRVRVLLDAPRVVHGGGYIGRDHHPVAAADTQNHE